MKSLKLVGASLIALAVVACESKEEKAVKFAENAQQYLDEGQLNRARIQFNNALKNDNNNAAALRGAAEVAERNKRYGQQLRYLQRLSNVEPDNLEVLAKVARLNLLAGRAERARRNANRVLDVDPTNIQALTVLGAAQVLENDLEGASETLERALEQDPNNAEVRNLLAARYVRDEDFAQASEVIETGLAEDPSNEALLVVRLLLTQRRQDVEGMDETFRRLIEASPENGFYKERYAEFLLAARRDLEGAREQFAAALPLLSDRNQTVGRLVGIIRTQDGDEAGEAALTEIIQSYPDDDALAFALPAYLCEIGQNERCTEELEKLAASEDMEIRHRAKIQIAENRFKDDDYDTAVSLAEEVLAEDDAEPNALTLKAKVQLARDEVEPAIETLRSALASEPDKESAQILLGLAYEADGRAAFGEAQLAQAIDRNGLSPTLFQAYRGMLARNGKTEEAADLTLRFAQTPEATPQVQRESAAVLLSQDRADEAEVVARGLIRADAGDQIARRILATAQLQQQRPEEAIDTIDAMTEEAQQDISSLQIKSQALFRLEKFDELRTYLDEEVQRANTPEAYILFSQAEARQGNLDRAETIVREGLSTYSDSETLYLSLFNTQIAQGKSEEAVATLEEARESAASSGNVRILLANSYLQDRRREDAKAVLNSLREDNLLNDLAANNLAAIMLETGDDPAEALSVAKRFEGTDQPFFADTLAWAHYRNGNLQDAKRYSDIAVAADINNAEILYHHGIISAAVGETDAARASLEKAVEAPGKSDLVNDEVIQRALNGL